MLTPEYDTVIVWEQTQGHYKDFPKQDSSVFRRNGDDITANEMASLKYRWQKQVIAPVINDDCIYVAIDYKERGFNPIILNMCDWGIAGGGVDYGSRAQEEELFRRSNYFKHLHQEYYPLKEADTIISHGVEFFRYGQNKGYTLMEQPVRIDCIAAPALRFPKLNESSYDFGNDDERCLMETKIRILLYSAAKNGNDCIILSAWGCGAYRCPPKAVAKMFKKILEEFAGVFRETPFAILGYNFLPFDNEFNSA